MYFSLLSPTAESLPGSKVRVVYLNIVQTLCFAEACVRGLEIKVENTITDDLSRFTLDIVPRE